MPWCLKSSFFISSRINTVKKRQILITILLLHAYLMLLRLFLALCLILLGLVNRSTKIGFICIVQYRLSLLLYSFYLKFLKNIWWSMSWWLVWIGYLCLLLIWFLLFWWFINHKLIQDREMTFYQLLLTSFIVLALLLGLRWVRFLVPGISKTHGLIWLY